MPGALVGWIGGEVRVRYFDGDRLNHSSEYYKPTCLHKLTCAMLVKYPGRSEVQEGGAGR